jgi:hypothetical protein
MNTYELQLYLTLCFFFEENRTNYFIRENFKQGMEIKIESYSKCKTYTYNLPPEKLTDSFLNDSRKLYKLITEESKTGHGTG